MSKLRRNITCKFGSKVIWQIFIVQPVFTFHDLHRQGDKKEECNISVRDLAVEMTT